MAGGRGALFIAPLKSRTMQEEKGGYVDYAVQHPVRSRYERLLAALGDVAVLQMKIRKGSGVPGDGRAAYLDAEEAMRDASVIEAEIAAGYFSDEDFRRVYGEAKRETLWVTLPDEAVSFETLSKRQAVVKRVCEENDWFEAEMEMRMSASEF